MVELEEENRRLVANHAVEVQFQRLSQMVESDDKELVVVQTRIKEEEDRIRSLHDQWIQPLQEVVGKISDTFSHNFSQIACAGEVVLREAKKERKDLSSLKTGETPLLSPSSSSSSSSLSLDDYENYAIELRVKFRERESLKVLESGRQSGGERSVTTIMFLTSLQGVTYTPFRVVDEINQGMDANNERKVYEQLVTAASRSHTPQCFLLTPKLLPNLTYNRHVNVLNLFHGPGTAQVADVFQRTKCWSSTGDTTTTNNTTKTTTTTNRSKRKRNIHDDDHNDDKEEEEEEENPPS